jgi:hypothetical protein
MSFSRIRLTRLESLVAALPWLDRRRIEFVDP